MDKITYEEIAELLLGMVVQHCHEGPDGVYDSGFIGINAEAIRALCDVGVMTAVHDGGGRCIQARIGGEIIDHASEPLLAIACEPARNDP